MAGSTPRGEGRGGQKVGGRQDSSRDGHRLLLPGSHSNAARVLKTFDPSTFFKRHDFGRNLCGAAESGAAARCHQLLLPGWSRETHQAPRTRPEDVCVSEFLLLETLSFQHKMPPLPFFFFFLPPMVKFLLLELT